MLYWKVVNCLRLIPFAFLGTAALVPVEASPMLEDWRRRPWRRGAHDSVRD